MNNELQTFLNTPLPQNFSSRYFQHWRYRWGLIPNVPINTDNSNSIYELLAWLQRGFKNLLDDFLELELEFEQFKNELIYMLEIVIPEIIREYVKSEEFQNIINNYIKEWFEKNVEERLKEIENNIKDLQSRVNTLETKVNNLETKVKELENRIEVLENGNEKLNKIIEKLKEIGVWENDGFKDGYGIGGGNINHYSNTPDGNYWIKTHSGTKDNDITTGI